MCVSLVCVLESFRASVSAFRVSELLVVRLSFVVKLFAFRLCVCEILKFSCRISNSNFSFRCSIRFLESRFLCRIWICRRIRFLEFRFEFVVEIFDSSVEFKFLEFRIRVFRFIALFDFSNLTLNSSSNSTSRISCRISNSNVSSKFLVEIVAFVVLFDFSNLILNSSSNSTSRNRSSNSTSRMSTSRVKCLEFDDSKLSSNFEFVLIYSTSRTLMIVKFSNCCSRSRILHLSS